MKRQDTDQPISLVSERFDEFTSGPFIASVGAQTEYHFFPEAAPRGGWSVSAFFHDETEQAWYVGSDDGRSFLEQRVINPNRHNRVANRSEA